MFLNCLWLGIVTRKWCDILWNEYDNLNIKFPIHGFRFLVKKVRINVHFAWANSDAATILFECESFVSPNW